MTSATSAAEPVESGIVAIEELLARARRTPDSVALIDGSLRVTYGQLADAAEALAVDLLDGRSDLDETRVVLMLDPTIEFVVALLAVLVAGGIAAPILPGLPESEIDYVVSDSEASILIADAANASPLGGAAERAGRHLVVVESDALVTQQSSDGTAVFPELGPGRGSLMIYTSGTTARPKGVIWHQSGLASQLAAMHSAWRWRDDDTSLLVLPLHHVHGLVNVVLTTLWSQATCVMLGTSNPETVWNSLVEDDISVFMAVPTIYHRLITAYDRTGELQQTRSAAAARLRLMVSGSAALPVTTLERWESITTHRLLERYGMSELGMILGNPYDGPRIAGTVGRPFPNVETRLVDDDGSVVDLPGVGTLEVRSPSVLREYFRRPDATRDAFHDGWFVTGDRVSIDADGVYRIVGRDSIDIIKTGGEKVSALEIEEVLRTHPAIADVAVVGAVSADWGEEVVAFVVAQAAADPATLDIAAIREWARTRLANYKLPRRVEIIDELPRNAMGKVTKSNLRSAD